MAHLESKKTCHNILFIICLAPIDFWKFLERSLMGQTGNISSNNVSHFLLLILQLPRPGNNTLPFQHPKGSIQLGRGGGKEAKKGSSFFTFVSSAFFFMCILSKPLYFLWQKERGGTKKCDMMVKYELLGCPKGQLGHSIGKSPATYLSYLLEWF